MYLITKRRLKCYQKIIYENLDDRLEHLSKKLNMELVLPLNISDLSDDRKPMINDYFVKDLTLPPPTKNG